MCHKLKRYRHVNELLHEQSQFILNTGSCAHYDGTKFCGNPTIKSHSIQRKRALSAIAENGKVLGFNSGPNRGKINLNEELQFSLIGNRQASTFPGFCSAHDITLFKDIESLPLKANYQTALKTAYRSQCYETIIHSNAALFLSWAHDVPTFDFHFNKAINEPEVSNMRWYAGYGWRLKELFEKIERRASTRKFLYFCCLFDTQLPFCGTGSFCIETDFTGNKLQHFSNVSENFNYAQVSVLPQENGTTFFSISAINDKNKKAAHQFIASLSNVPKHELASCALRSLIVHSENVYFKPSYINCLPYKHRQEILDRFDDSEVQQVGLEKIETALSYPLSFDLLSNAVKISTNITKVR